MQILILITDINALNENINNFMLNFDVWPKKLNFITTKKDDKMKKV
jgi:hypothetical protein